MWKINAFTSLQMSCGDKFKWVDLPGLKNNVVASVSHSLLLSILLRMESDWKELASWSSGWVLRPSWTLSAKANIGIVRCQPWTHLQPPRGEQRWPVNRYQVQMGRLQHLWILSVGHIHPQPLQNVTISVDLLHSYNNSSPLFFLKRLFLVCRFALADARSILFWLQWKSIGINTIK